MENLNVKNLKYNEPLNLHCTMGVGGISKFYIEPDSKQELIAIIRLCKHKGIKYFILGNGSNVIFKDSGYNGIVICTKRIKKLKIKYNMVEVDCGTNLFVLNNYLIKNGLSGLEWSYGIPGTIGGAVCMNAGAYGGQMQDVVFKIKVFDGQKTKILYNNQLQFGYRNSLLRLGDFVVLKVWLKLKKGNPKDIEHLCKSYFSKRKISQPLEFNNSGSIFKKIGEISSGKLIDNLGLKGAKISGAQVSTLHANFIINTGNATSKDIEQLIDLIQQKVFQKYGTNLEREVIFVGE